MKIDKVNILIGEDINPKLYVLKYTLEDCNNKIISSSYSVDIFKVIEFARKIHKDQKRKYTGDPYFSHLCEVVGLLSSVNNDNLSLAVAWLHDCMEDCGVSFEFLKENFGPHVAMGVSLMSDMEAGNRETRKRLSRERLSKAPSWIQNIKLCDIISNTNSIFTHDPKFYELYHKETKLLLDVLGKSDPNLWKLAKNVFDNKFEEDEEDEEDEEYDDGYDSSW